MFQGVYVLIQLPNGEDPEFSQELALVMVYIKKISVFLLMS